MSINSCGSTESNNNYADFNEYLNRGYIADCVDQRDYDRTIMIFHADVL